MSVSGEGGEQARGTEMAGVDAIRLEGSAPPSQRRKTGGSTSRAKSSAAGAKSIKDALTNTLIAKMRTKFKVREAMGCCSGALPRSHDMTRPGDDVAQASNERVRFACMSGLVD